jgi:hypothetical protein
MPVSFSSHTLIFTYLAKLVMDNPISKTLLRKSLENLSFGRLWRLDRGIAYRVDRRKVVDY